MNSPFEKLNQADEQMEVSAKVEDRLRAEVRAIASRRRSFPYEYLAVAASLALIIGAGAWFMRDTDRAGMEQTRLAEQTTESVTDFVPLGYNRIPAASATQIVRLEVPRKALASFGLLPMDSTASPDSETVLADVIIGDDGLARAVRFVRSTSH
jgi:hypothetical protein